MNKRYAAPAVLGAYVSTIVAANWAISEFGVVPVGFGLAAPAGVFFAGLGFSLRDAGQEIAGKRAVVAAILVGAGISYLMGSGSIAVASAIAFLISEMADFAVYSPLRKRGRLRAVAASNIVGLVFDSLVFLWVVFGSLAFLPGQIVGKVWVTVLTLAILAPLQLRRTAAR